MTPPTPPEDEDLARLSTLARDGGVVVPVLLRVQADLFAAARLRDEATVASFAELVHRLLPRADADTAAQVARRVAALPETPVSLLRALASRGGEAARLVAALAPHALPEDEPAEPLVALARARRGDLAPAEIERLVARDDPAVDTALAENPDLVLQGRARATLVARARDGGASAGAMARALLLRDDLSADEAAALYVHADEAMRGSILLRLAASPRAAARPLPRPRPSPAARTALLEASDRGDRAAFGSRLAAILNLARTPDWRFDEPSRHDLLAFALLAAGTAEEEAVRVFLTLHPAIARSVETVFRLVRLSRSTPRSVAGRLVEALYDVEIRAHGDGARHAPHFAPDERRRGASFGTLLGPRGEAAAQPPKRLTSGGNTAK